MSAALRCDGLTVRFGGFTAIDDVTLSFARERLYGVIGPNGAGKTTLVNALSGRQRPTGGTVHLNGVDATGLGVAARTRLGIGRSFQITTVFPQMTVFENLRLAGQARAFSVQPFWRGIGAYRNLAARADAMLDRVGLRPLRDLPAEKVSHGDQRALELGMALMTEPTTLLLDEPLAGVNQGDIGRTIDLIRTVAQGRTVLLIEHNMRAVMSLCDEIVVMVAGRVLAQGAPDEIRRSAAVRKAYLGDDDAGA